MDDVDIAAYRISADMSFYLGLFVLTIWIDKFSQMNELESDDVNET